MPAIDKSPMASRFHHPATRSRTLKKAVSGRARSPGRHMSIFLSPFFYDSGRQKQFLRMDRIQTHVCSQGIDKTALLQEISNRKDVLHWMRVRNIRSYKDVAAIIGEYYARPKDIYEKIQTGEELRVASSQKT